MIWVLIADVDQDRNWELWQEMIDKHRPHTDANGLVAVPDASPRPTTARDYFLDFVPRDIEFAWLEKDRWFTIIGLRRWRIDDGAQQL